MKQVSPVRYATDAFICSIVLLATTSLLTDCSGKSKFYDSPAAYTALISRSSPASASPKVKRIFEQLANSLVGSFSGQMHAIKYVPTQAIRTNGLCRSSDTQKFVWLDADTYSSSEGPVRDGIRVFIGYCHDTPKIVHTFFGESDPYKTDANDIGQVQARYEVAATRVMKHFTKLRGRK